MSRSSAGQAPLITAFYSFKGGVGRSLAAYNTALRVASRQQRVLLVDADLEAPGLTLALVASDKRQRLGGFAEILADVIDRLEEAWTHGQTVDGKLPGALAQEVESQAQRVWRMPEPEPLAQSLATAFPEHAEALSALGSVSLLTVGQVHFDFTSTLRRLDAAALFEKHLEARHERLILAPLELKRDECPTLGHVAARLLRAALASPRWNQVFIDSRTGLAEIGGICFRHVADRRVVISGLNRQNIEGTRLVLDRLLPEMRVASDLAVVLSPVPNGELELLRERHDAAAALFETKPLSLPYMPRLALIEEAFSGDAYDLSPLAQAYDKLAERVLGMTGADAETLSTRVLEALHAPSTEPGDTNWDDVTWRLLQLAVASRTHARDIVAAMAVSLTSNYEGGVLPERLKAQLRDLMQLWPVLEVDDDADRLATLATGLAIGGALLGVAYGRALFEQAFEKYGRALELKPDFHEALYNWANAFYNFGMLLGPVEGRQFFDQAFERYARALELKPDMHEAAYNWGNALYHAGRLLNPAEARLLFDQASEKYARTLELKPDIHEALNNWGNALSEIGKLSEPARQRPVFERAFEKYARALELKPDKHEALYNWGNALYHLGKLLGAAEGQPFFDQALEKYTRAVAIKRLDDAEWVAHVQEIATLGAGRLSTAALARARALLETVDRSGFAAPGASRGRRRGTAG